jgi:hypothetical protein
MTNKLLLAAIAVGLWANVLTSWVKPARADSEGDLHSISFKADEIYSTLEGIADGRCKSQKICGS